MRLLATLGSCLLLGLTSFALGAEQDTRPKKLWVFVGTYTQGKSQGIYRVELDLTNGSFGMPSLAAEVVNPSFLAIHPSRRYLYAVDEINDFAGKPAGAVTAFALDPQTGALRKLNQQTSGGTGPCYITVDRQGKNALVANYGGGSVEAIPIGSDGQLGAPSTFIQHQGSSVDARRQQGPHAHSINLDAANRFAVAADLGLDQLLVYKFDPASGKLTPNEPPFARVEPGSGPRHFAFHPDGRHAYVINEMAKTVTAFDYDPERGVLTSIQTISTLPAGSERTGSTAEVQVHPSGKFLYGSNRGHNSIAIFSIDAASGRLAAVGHQSTGGKTPRNFGIDPTGAFLLAANQDSDTIVLFRIDQQSGQLQPTGQQIDVPKPVCVKMIPQGQ